MSETQYRADTKHCWSCGEQGSHLSGSQMQCRDCDVTWLPWSSSLVNLDEVWWEGSLIACVDFTEPGALNCPA